VLRGARTPRKIALLGDPNHPDGVRSLTVVTRIVAVSPSPAPHARAPLIRFPDHPRRYTTVRATRPARAVCASASSVCGIRAATVKERFFAGALGAWTGEMTKEHRDQTNPIHRADSAPARSPQTHDRAARSRKTNKKKMRNEPTDRAWRYRKRGFREKNEPKRTQQRRVPLAACPPVLNDQNPMSSGTPRAATATYCGTGFPAGQPVVGRPSPDKLQCHASPNLRLVTLARLSR
jgi:hypothetical protein